MAIRNLEADIRPKKILAKIEVGVVMWEWSHDVRPKGMSRVEPVSKGQVGGVVFVVLNKSFSSLIPTFEPKIL